MTIVYVPRLIETAEQAEALPGGSIVLDHESKWTYTDYFIAARPPLSGLQDDLDHGAHVVALVPIEAEEEQVAVAKASDGTETCYNPDAASHPVFGGYIGSLPIHARYVTPWEEV